VAQIPVQEQQNECYYISLLFIILSMGCYLVETTMIVTMIALQASKCNHPAADSSFAVYLYRELKALLEIGEECNVTHTLQAQVCK